jgi:hypothetical protein
VNTSFKHLDSKLRVADLTIRQWVGIFVGVMLALAYADLLHPFGTMMNLMTATYIAGIPIAIAIVAGFSEFDAWLVMRSAWSWRSNDGRYLPGPGNPTDGYHVHDPLDGLYDPDHEPLRELDPAGLWGER